MHTFCTSRNVLKNSVFLWTVPSNNTKVFSGYDHCSRSTRKLKEDGRHLKVYARERKSQRKLKTPLSKMKKKGHNLHVPLDPSLPLQRRRRPCQAVNYSDHKDVLLKSYVYL